MRTNKGSHQPIRSAGAVAALRAASAKEADLAVANPDYFARMFTSVSHRALLALPRFLVRRLVETISPGSYCYFLARTKFIDGHLEEVREWIDQVVVLGAGYDSRAYRFEDELRRARVFEVDLPATQDAKLRRLTKLGIAPVANVSYVPLDLNAKTLKTALGEAGFDRSAKTFFIWEDVSYFLEESAVIDVFDFVGMECGAGSSIVFDYALQSFVEGDHRTYGGRQIGEWIRRNDEPFLFGLEKRTANGFMQERGLDLVCALGPEEMKELFLTRKNGQRVGEPLGHLRLAYSRNLGENV